MKTKISTPAQICLDEFSDSLREELSTKELCVWINSLIDDHSDAEEIVKILTKDFKKYT